MPSSYRNPIIPGFNPDPSICRVGKDYFLATSTFEYFPGVPIYHSTDLVRWSIIGHALNRPSQLDMRVAEAGGGIFAPSLRYNDKAKRWYMTTSCQHKGSKRAPHDTPPGMRGFYVWTDDIFDETRWSDPIYYDILGIDQDLFWDDDGAVYLSYADSLFDGPKFLGLEVYTVPLDLDTGDHLARRVLQRQDTHSGNNISEGPHMYKRGQWYYLMTAEGGTEKEHQEWIQRARAPFGPWEVAPTAKDVEAGTAKHAINPLVFNHDDPHIQHTGHMDLVEGTGGQWWAVFLGTRDHNGKPSQLGRESFLAPVEWIDDWPVVNGGKIITIDGDKKAGLERVPAREEWSYDFKADMDLAKHGFYTLRTPQKPFWCLSSHPGSLAIKGGPFGLKEDETLSMLLLKQTAFIGTWRVTLDYAPQEVGEEAGAAVWWSKWAHGAVSIRGVQNGDTVGAQLVFRAPEVDGNGFTENTFPLPANIAVDIRVDATVEGYTFFATVNGKEQQVGTMLSTQLVRQRPFDSIFTGTFFALFACGVNGCGSLQPAVFSDFSWRGVLGEE